MCIFWTWPFWHSGLQWVETNQYITLEGSVAIAGAVVRWLRDNLGIIKTSEEIKKLAKEVGTPMVAISSQPFQAYMPLIGSPVPEDYLWAHQFTNKCHIAFAALEAVCFPNPRNSGRHEPRLWNSTQSLAGGLGGMTNKQLWCNCKPTFCISPGSEALDAETTALGAAMAAGAAEGVGGGVLSLRIYCHSWSGLNLWSTLRRAKFVIPHGRKLWSPWIGLLSLQKMVTLASSVVYPWAFL